MLRMKYVQPVFPGTPRQRQRNPQERMPRTEALQSDMAVAANLLPRRCIRIVQDQLMRTGKGNQPSG